MHQSSNILVPLQAYNRGLYDWLILAGQWQKPTPAAPTDEGVQSDSDTEPQPGTSKKRKRPSTHDMALKNVTCGLAVDPPESAAGNLLPSSVCEPRCCSSMHMLLCMELWHAESAAKASMHSKLFPVHARRLSGG